MTLSATVSIPIGKGIAGHCALTGESMFIEHAHSHPMFNADVDKATGYYTRNIMACPLRDNHNQIVAVIQLLNKDRASKMRHTLGAVCATKLLASPEHMAHVKLRMLC